MPLGRAFYRFRQAWFLLFAQMKSEDQSWVNRYLNINEAALFNQLPAFEQKHSVRTSREMVRLGREHRELDERLLAKTGLLHDVGKVACHLSLLTKGILVILHAFIPPLYNWFAYLGRKQSSPNFFRKFYVHKKHGRIGARMLSRAGVETQIVKVVSNHTEHKKKHISTLEKLLNVSDEYY